MVIKRWPLLVTVGALTMVVPLLALAPGVEAQTFVRSLPVDVDLIEGGVWVTYADGCVESRAWRWPVDDGDVRYESDASAVCAGSLSAGPHYPFYRARVIRRSLDLAVDERVVALVPTDGGVGYWLITSVGRVVTGGSAQSLGDLSAFKLNAPVVAAAATVSGDGYYMLTLDGGVFTFGDARFYGSVQGLVDTHVGAGALAADYTSAPILTLASTPAGYWLVGLDGAVYPFGDAKYYGSIQDALNLGNQLGNVSRNWELTPVVAPGVPRALDALDAPVIGVVSSTGGDGYQMVAADGGIFTFGAAQFHGSLAGRTTSRAVASDATASRSGYVILTEDGTVHPFGVVGRQPDLIGRAPTPQTPAALPASECQPRGHFGIPPSASNSQAVGAWDVAVLFVEFDDYQADQENEPVEAFDEDLRLVEEYVEAVSYGKHDVRIRRDTEWRSVGPLREEFQHTHGSVAVGVGTGQLLNAIVRAVDDDFDLSNQQIGYDGILVVLPPSLFRGGTSLGYASEVSVSGVTVGPIALAGSFGPYEERRTSRYQSGSWWYLIAHELLHQPGLHDLYARSRSDYSYEWKDTWLSTVYDIHVFQTLWPGRPDKIRGRGQITLASGETLIGNYHSNWGSKQARATEMLAWRRWRMGWLRADQILCLAPSNAAFDLAPIADPGTGLAMAAVHLTDTEFLVLEHRQRRGMDADERSKSGGSYIRKLPTEGVLPYVVDITGRQADLPIRIFPDGRELQPGEDWILQSGDGVSTVLAGGETLTVSVIRNAARPGDSVSVSITMS